MIVRVSQPGVRLGVSRNKPNRLLTVPHSVLMPLQVAGRRRSVAVENVGGGPRGRELDRTRVAGICLLVTARKHVRIALRFVLFRCRSIFGRLALRLLLRLPTLRQTFLKLLQRLLVPCLVLWRALHSAVKEAASPHAVQVLFEHIRSFHVVARCAGRAALLRQHAHTRIENVFERSTSYGIEPSVLLTLQVQLERGADALDRHLQILFRLGTLIAQTTKVLQNTQQALLFAQTVHNR
mmetsp:Transcript_15511/g.49528  ORF Transcript_15511/g.49528 Transcript_15511/m.49528 type:complete len:238 (-) Transcript_15511:9-722(-)